MRRTQARQLGPSFAPGALPDLKSMRCIRCDAVGVTIMAMGRNDNGAIELAWCAPDCAANDGWPWLHGERERPRPGAAKPN
jgi:hypothetical protein